MERNEDEPNVCTDRLGTWIRTIADDILREPLLYPYRVQNFQELLPIYPSAARILSIYKEQKLCRNIDEAQDPISPTCTTNMFSIKNPHAIKVTHHQYQFKINVWADIIARNLIGPVEIPDKLYVNALFATDIINSSGKFAPLNSAGTLVHERWCPSSFFCCWLTIFT